MDLSGKKILMVIAPSQFRDEEYYEPKDILEGYDAKITTCSLNDEAISSSGKRQKIDVLLDDVKGEYDAVIFVGGVGSSIYFNNGKAHELAKNFNNGGKIVAAICIAPSTLANAGLLSGKNVTSFPSERGNLESRGAKYTGEDVTVDGNIITANGPKAARQFGEEIAKKL